MDRTLPEGTVANAPVTLDHGATADELASTEALKAYLDKSMPLQSDDERAANEVRVTHTHLLRSRSLARSLMLLVPQVTVTVTRCLLSR